MAKRRAAEDALKIIAQKDATVAAAAISKQAAELQAAIGMPELEAMAIDNPAESPPLDAAVANMPIIANSSLGPAHPDNSVAR